MADDLDELHAQAGLALLDADAVLTVYDGKVPDPTPAPPYVLVYTTVARPSGEAGAANALDGASQTFVTRWMCHCVGESAAAARAVAMRVRAALLDQRPTIAGRSCNPIRQDDVQSPVKDETTGRPVMDLVATYSMITTP